VLEVVAVDSEAAGVGALIMAEVLDMAGGAEANLVRTGRFRVLLV